MIAKQKQVWPVPEQGTGPKRLEGGECGGQRGGRGPGRAAWQGFLRHVVFSCEEAPKGVRT